MLSSLRLNLNTLHFSIHFASIKSSGCLAPCLAGHVSTSPWNRKLHDKGSKNLYMRNWIIYERRRSRHRHNHFFKPSVTIRKHSGHAWVSTSDVSAWPWRDLSGNSHQNLSHQAQRASLHARSANTSGARRSRMRCAARRTWRLGSSLQRKTWRKSRRKRVLGIPQRHLEKLTVTFRFFHGGATFVTTCGLIISFSLLQMEDSWSFPQSTRSILSKALFPASRDSRCSCWGLSFRRVWSAASRTGQSSSCKASTMRGTCGKQRMLAF